MPNIDDIYKSKYTGEEIDELLDKVQLQDFTYDSLKDKPIINQDLLIGGFTPQENTYYRHTGRTASGFAKGIIYLYSGGKYTAIKGGGKDGTTFTPSVSEDGIISWTNDGGKENPAPVNIKGPKGDSGVASGTVNSNTEGTSDTDGYTQQAVNKIASRPNLLINPDFAINQRGQESYKGAGYGVDRWKGYQLNTMVCTPKSDGVNLTAPTSSTGTGAIYRQIIEPEQVARLAGKTITFSFMATNRGSAGIYMRCLTPASVGDTPNIVSGETKIVSKTVTLAADITELQFVFRKGGGTLDVDIKWAKAEIGSVATAFSHPSIAEELIKCQRYYQKLTSVGTYHCFASAWVRTNTTTQNIRAFIPFITTMRSKPTFSYSGNLGFLSVGTILEVAQITLDTSTNKDAAILSMSTVSATTAGNGGGLVSNNDTAAYLAFDAEL